MQLEDLQLSLLSIDPEKFSRIITFIDFGNVNHWYDKDERDWEGNQLLESQKLIVDIERLADFINTFSIQKRFYYGLDTRRGKQSSWHITIKAEKVGFIKITKPIQFIKHFVSPNNFVEIPKGNFDVEISVDVIHLIEKYDTLCLFSGDSDFAYLASYIKRKGKKVIIVASGRVFHTLKDLADLYINAQQIKAFITSIKQTSPLTERSLNIGSVSDGQDSLSTT